MKNQVKIDNIFIPILGELRFEIPSSARMPSFAQAFLNLGKTSLKAWRMHNGQSEADSLVAARSDIRKSSVDISKL
jgi:hypothetical protein